MAEPNSVWQQPTPTVPRTTIASPGIFSGEVQTIGLGAASAGSITITFQGQTTGSIAFNANAGTVQTALIALSNVATGDVVVTGGPLPGTITLTFGGAYKDTDVSQVTVTPTGLTGGTVTVATSTAGHGTAADQVNRQWHKVVSLGLHLNHPLSLNGTAPGEDF